MIKQSRAEAIVSPYKIALEEYPLLLILSLIQFSQVVDFLIMMPLGPQFMRVFSIGPQKFSYLLSSYSFSAALFGLAGSFIVDKFDRKTTLLVLLTLFTVGLMVCSMSMDYFSLLIGRIITGASGGNLSALILAVIADTIPKSRCGRATGFVLSSFSIASVLGMPLGLYAASEFSWKVPYNVLAIFSLLTLLIALYCMPSVKTHIQNSNDKNLFRSIISNSSLLRGLIFIFLLSLGGYTVTSFFSPYLVSNLKLTEVELSYIYLAGGLATLVTSPMTGKFIDRFSEKKVFTISAAASILPLLAVTFLSPVSRLIIFFIAILFFTFLNCRFISAMSIINSSVDSCKRGSFMGLNSAVQQISLGMAAMLSGAIIHRAADGELIHFEVAGLVAVACTFLSIFISSKIKSI